MKKSSLKFKKYLAGVLLVLTVVALIGLLRFGNLDKLKGTIKVKDVYLSSVKSKLNANVLDAIGNGPVVSNGYDEVSYELKYKLSDSTELRDVIITGTLDADNNYATFKRLTGNNITSTLSENDRKIEIVIRDVPANTEITTNVALTVNGAPDGYRITPTFKIKETTAEDYTDVYTNPIEVSTNNLRGIVTNYDGERVSDIIVSVYKNKKLIKETYTNSNGEYIISDLSTDDYTVRINEEIYQDPNVGVSVSGDTVLNLVTERIYPFNMEVHKYITKVDAHNVGTPILKTYDRASTVALPIKKLTSFGGKVYYSIVVENSGSKEGIVTAIKDELPSFMEFDEKENSGWELKNGYIYDRNLEGITLKPGQKIEDTLVLTIKDTNEARTYLNRVNALGEIYEHVVYLLDGNTYREEDVLEGEQIKRPTDPIDNFGGWYTDSEYTNKYNFNNLVTKDLILYGKTTQKYTVEFYDKDPESGDEELYTSKEVNGGDPVDEPNNHPDHTGYNFDYWCTVDFNEYNFNLPVNSDLKLISCYTIKEFDVNFYNYSDTKEKTIKVEYKKLIDATEAPTFDETGYTFICWTEDKTNCYDFTTPVTSNVDLYPKHEILTNAVVFNDENRITTVDNIPYGNTVDPIDNQGKDGHTFRCWSEDRTNCFDFTTPIIETKTVYAIYDINQYTVTFIDRNPETLVDTQYGNSQTINWGNTATKPGTDPEHYGYTFITWTKEDGTTYNFETPVKSDLTLISSYNINTYPVNFHDGNNVTTVNVEYKHTVTPITSPTKEHHVFKNWLDENDAVFNFATLIIEETDLYSSYEEVLPPVISHEPTMWTNQNVTVTISDNPSLVDNTGYSYLYKAVNSNYNTYGTPFAVEANTTIIAKSMKSDVDSVVTNHEIVNIDKLNPTITEFTENVANKNSATLNVSVQDNESGINYYEVYQDNVKVGEKHFECYNYTTYDEYESCRSSLPTERVTTYTVTGLNSSTTYTFKIKAFDKAGNFVWSDDLEVTTTTPRIVARLIGYNDNLFEDAIDSTTGDVIVHKEDKYINFESLAEAFDYEDLYDCKNVQCTIQMVTNTDESVVVLEGQNLTLDLNGKTVSGVSSEYTIKNNGDFTLIESTPEGEDPGKLINMNGVSLLNKTGANFTLGEGYSDIKVTGSVVSQTKPYIYGETVGVKSETNATFTMFDGKIVAPASQTPGLGAVNGKVTGTEYSYEAVSNNETINEKNCQVVTLNILVSPEARINNSVYYARLDSAMNNATKGTSTTTPSDTRSLMEDLMPAGEYAFEYDDQTETWISHSGKSYDRTTKAKSYLIIDLTNETNDKVLNINYSFEVFPGHNSASYYINNYRNEVANITVNKYENHGKTLGESVNYINRTLTDTAFELKAGEKYILNISHLALGTEYSELTIHDITLSDLEKNTNNIDVQNDVNITSYGFYYDESDKTIKSSNQYVNSDSAAFGYIELDLTDKEGYYVLTVNSSMESYASVIEWNMKNYSQGRMTISEDKNPTSGNYLADYYGSTTSSADVYVSYDPEGHSNGNYGGFHTYGPRTSTATLEGGKKYYLKFFYKKNVKDERYYPTQSDYESAGCRDQFIINYIDLHKRPETSTQVDITSMREVSNNIMEELYNNSNGGLTLDEDGTSYITTISMPNQVINSRVPIDLTDDTKGKMLVVKYSRVQSSTGFDQGYYYSSWLMVNKDLDYNYTDTCTNCIYAFQNKTLSDGTQVKPRMPEAVSYEGDYDSVTKDYMNNYMLIPLQGGFTYDLVMNINMPNVSATKFPQVRIEDIKLYDYTAFEGNYFNSITMYDDQINTWFTDGTINHSNTSAISSNIAYIKDAYRDSFKKIDLTNADKDQILSFNFEGISGGISEGKYYVYLTNNNRALSKEELFANRDKMIANNGTNAYVVLEKGKVYYLHFASTGPAYLRSEYYSYYNSIAYSQSTIRISDMRLSPIDDYLLKVGAPYIFTGSVNLTDDREELYNTTRRTSENPIITDDITPYGFEYNEENGMYEALNTEVGSVAIKKFKIDLTNATTDRLYTITYNGGTRNYYTFSDNESDLNFDINNYTTTYSSDYNPHQYLALSNNVGFKLEKGKEYYFQIITYKEYSSTERFSFRLDEMNSEDATNEYHTVEEIREFNENVDTVQLLKDVTTDNAINVDFSEEVILDLNGYNLTSNDDYVINNGGDLTIVDTKYDRTLANYDHDLAEYQEYAGLCDGCTEPSDEYKLDHIFEYAAEFGIDLNDIDDSDIHDFAYTGDVQEFVAPESGLYKLQVWGAQGGYRGNASFGGKGGYSEGMIELQAGDRIFIYVGGSGNTGGANGGFNGGGTRSGELPGGGGATDMRIEGSTLYNRIIVAGGGGSDGASNKPGKYGGGLTGGSATESYGTGGSGGTQTGPGTDGYFGTGGSGITQSGGNGGAGGGGWYGGGGSTPDSSADDDRGGGGGSGYVYTRINDGYLVTNHVLTNASTIAGNTNVPTYDGTSTMVGNSGDGYAKITCIIGSELEELKSNLTKRYNVKVEPNLGNLATLTNSSGVGIIHNEKDSILTLNNLSLNVSRKHGILNEGIININGSPVINVTNNQSIGIENTNGGNIVNNGQLEVTISTNNCSINYEYGAVGISYAVGEHDLSNVKITGQSGVGILVKQGTKLGLHSSNINLSNTCNYAMITNNVLQGTTGGSSTYGTEYNKRFHYYQYGGYSSYSNRYMDVRDGAIYNKGTIDIDNGTNLVGIVNNAGTANIYNGVGFRTLYQFDTTTYEKNGWETTTVEFENPITNIYNTVSNVDVIVNSGGTLNINEEEGQTSSITTDANHGAAVINLDKANINGGSISSLYNAGELISNNADFGKLYNIRSIVCNENDCARSAYDAKGYATINGGSITTDLVLNDYKMTLNGVNVQNGVVNRKDLVVKGNTTITGPEKTAIYNLPFVIPEDNNYTYGAARLQATVTLGEDDGEVTAGPTINTTNDKYAITGGCNTYGTTVFDDYSIEFDYQYRTVHRLDAEGNTIWPNDDTAFYLQDYALGDYNIRLVDPRNRNSYGAVSLDSKDYPNSSTNSCQIKYYDGKLQNTSVTNMTDVVDIPIKDIASGYDVLYDNSDLTGKVTLETINSSSRGDLIDVNGTSYKSLETAIANAADNSIITISGNYDSANKVVIPEGKNLTLNLAAGTTLNSFSRDALITNNGTLNITGSGTNNVIGEFTYENNGTMTFNGTTNNNNKGNYFKQSNLFKNNANLTINDITSNQLDIVSLGADDENHSSLTITDGVFKSNTIFGKNTDITVNGGYYDTDTNTNYYEITYNNNKEQQLSRTKPLFNVKNSNVNITDFDAENDPRYTNIELEQNLGRFTNSVLSLNNSKFGGKSSKPKIDASILNSSTVNVNGGEYKNLHFFMDSTYRTYWGGNGSNGDTFNQTAGTINGELFVTGNNHVINITGGKIISNDTSAINLTSASATEITVGTKGGNVSKTDPEIRGGTFGISAGGNVTVENNLYFYDGIFKGSSNPIEIHLEEIEDGYDVAYRKDVNPKEKYLDILPMILNYTTGVYYYDVQEAFDAANTDDELIWLRDYTNYSYSPAFEVADGKKFTLYFSYTKAQDTPIYYQYYLISPQDRVPVQDEFKPYSGTETIPDGAVVETSRVKINNMDTLTEEVPFILNNGNLTIVGMPDYASLSQEPIFETVSGARIVINNGILNLNRVSTINIKAKGTMLKNYGTMNIYQSSFQTQQANIITNDGTVNFVGDGTETSGCYNPSYIKIIRTQSLEDLYNRIKDNYDFEIHQLFSESIINNANAIMNINYLHYDSDYGFTAIYNNGTMDINDSSIELYRNDSVYETLFLEKSIINHGTMTTNGLTLIANSGIENTGTLHYGGLIDAGLDSAINNLNGTISFSGTIRGGGKGIVDTGDTTTINGSITTYEETYYGTGTGTTTMTGSFTTKGYNPNYYDISYPLVMSCSNGTDATNRTISGRVYKPKYKYKIGNGAIYVAYGRNLVIDNSGVSIDSVAVPLLHYCEPNEVDGCRQPYAHDGENGRNYTIASIEAQNASVTIENGGISTLDNSFVYGIYANHSNVNIKGGYVGQMFVNNSDSEDITVGVQGGTNSPYLGPTQCYASTYKGINFYDGYVNLDPNKICHFNDKPVDKIIYNSSNQYSDYQYSLGTPMVVENTTSGGTYATVQEAVTNATSGDTLKLINKTAQITSDFDITIDKDITLDLNGKSLDANLNITSGTTNITDLEVVNNGYNNIGIVTNVTNTSGTLNVDMAIINKIDSSSQTTINNGTIRTINSTDTLIVNNGGIDTINTSGTITVNDGTISKVNNTGTATVNGPAVSISSIIDTYTGTGTSSLDIVSGVMQKVVLRDNSTLSLTSNATLKRFENASREEMSFNTGTFETLVNNGGTIIMGGASVTVNLTNVGTLTVNSGNINSISNGPNNETCTMIINGGTIGALTSKTYWGSHIINNGTIGSALNDGYLTILGGDIGYVTNEHGTLTIGEDDGIVNTMSPRITNLYGYAIHSPSNYFVQFYDGIFTSNKAIVIDATITRVPEGYSLYTAPNYDEHGNLTGTYSMILKTQEETDTKIACVQGICYATLQEAIDASVRNYDSETGCPEVRIGDEFYFSVELDEDLVLDPQYTVSVNLNYHNINDNGYNIPDNIQLRNGSRNGTDLQSSLSKFLSNVLGIDDTKKDIIITKMEDGNALDTAKTYKFYRLENGTYKPLKMDSDGAGKYTIGKESENLKSIKGRIYINDLGTGEYMLKDNYDNELQFTIYDDGTVSQNVTLNKTSDYGHMTASAVATLIVSIQTGQFRFMYLLIGLMVVTLIIILLLNIKRKSKKETI